eukprot:TRINITY_DN12699_c0_g1_i1.p1 TRINITY_DN12699_c0_g1~~TRINITY_DN12699_c0_g1_i1.p1  ORF type:complete len:256 (-),score=42.92 TRINITY_DN12699_c0_g1_i1:548-1315(-)
MAQVTAGASVASFIGIVNVSCRPEIPSARQRRWTHERQIDGRRDYFRVSCMAKKEKAAKGPGKKAALKAEGKESASPPPPPLPYLSGEVIMHSLAVIDSYFRATGKPIFPSSVEISVAAKALWELPRVVVTQGTEEDPLYNYGNKAALDLFEMDWPTFTSSVARKWAPEEEQTAHSELVKSAVQGVQDIGGLVRVTSSGQTFKISQGAWWALTTLDGEPFGQGAVFDIESPEVEETAEEAVPEQVVAEELPVATT